MPPRSKNVRGLKRAAPPSKVSMTAPRQAHPDSVVTTNIDVSSWAARVLERKRAAGEVLSSVQVALAQRIVPRAAVVSDASPPARSVFISKKFGGGAGQLVGQSSGGGSLQRSEGPAAPAVHGGDGAAASRREGVAGKLDMSLDALVQNSKRRRL